MVPPDFSAVAMAVRAYKLLAMEKSEASGTPIKIFSFQMTEYNEKPESESFFVRCSGGTYIRTLQ